MSVEREDIQVGRGIVKPLTIGAHNDLVEGLWQAKHHLQDAIVDARELAEFVTGERQVPETVSDPESFKRTMAELWLHRYGEFAERS